MRAVDLLKHSYRLVGVLPLTVCIACTPLSQAPETGSRPIIPNRSSTELRIVSSEFNYAPDTLQAVSGVPIQFTLDNRQAATEHALVIPALNVRMEAKAGQVISKTLVFDNPGQYEFHCDLPGHTEAGMKGRLVIAP